MNTFYLFYETKLDLVQVADKDDVSLQMIYVGRGKIRGKILEGNCHRLIGLSNYPRMNKMVGQPESRANSSVIESPITFLAILTFSVCLVLR